MRKLSVMVAVLSGSFPLAAQFNRLPGAITQQTFPSQLGRSIAGLPALPLHGRTGPGIVPYLLFGSGSGYFTPLPPVFVMQPQPAPSVVINQTFASPPPSDPAVSTADDSDVKTFRAAVAEDSPPASKPPQSVVSSRDSLYVIALKHGGDRDALAYWYEDGMLHYVGPDHGMHAAAVADIDTERSRQLNRERGFDFHLPE